MVFTGLFPHGPVRAARALVCLALTLAVAFPALTYRYLETRARADDRHAAPVLPPLSSDERSSYAAAAARPGTSFDVLGYPGSVSVVAFAAHLRMLAVTGYRSVSARQVVDALDGRQALPRRAVLITFDGGHPRTWSYADPVLARYGFSAAVFVDPAEVGRRRYLNWDELFAMGRSGRWSVEIGLPVARLRPVDDPRRAAGLLGRARAAVVDHGLPMPLLFSYPSPAGPLVRLAGVVDQFFAAAVASDPPGFRGPRLLRRSVVAAGTTDRTLLARLGARSDSAGEAAR